jgi:hypothetical protein
MFIEPAHSLIDFAAAAHGVLSLIFRHQLQDRSAADRPAFQQADHRPHVRDDRRVGWDRRRLARRSLAPSSPSPAGGPLVPSALIEIGLLFFALGRSVISGRALCGGLLAVSLPATEGTAQIVASGIAGVGEKEKTTVPAPGQAGSQVRQGSQHRSQQPVILQYQGGYQAPAIPVGFELKMLCDPYCKKAKLALKVLR